MRVISDTGVDNTGVTDHDNGDTNSTIDEPLEKPLEKPPEEEGVPEEPPDNAGVLAKDPPPPLWEGIRSNWTWIYGHHVGQDAVISTSNHLSFYIRGEQLIICKRHKPDPLEEFVPLQTQKKGMNLGLNMFVGAGTCTIHKEMMQTYNRCKSIPVEPEYFWGETSSLH